MNYKPKKLTNNFEYKGIEVDIVEIEDGYEYTFYILDKLYMGCYPTYTKAVNAIMSQIDEVLD